MERSKLTGSVCFAVYLVLLIINLCYSSSSSTSPSPDDKLPYMTSNVDEVSGKSYDYIIVGGGAGGCPLAATLSDKFSVLLIERGDSPYKNPLILRKNNYGVPLLQTDEHSSVAQSFVSTDGVANHRGRVLGGGTAINGGFYSRAGKSYVETVGWEKNLVAESYEWVESRLISRPDLSLWQTATLRGLVEKQILPYNGFSFEHIRGTKIGGSLFDGSGRRHLASDLLSAGNPANIVVLLNVTVRNVIFHNNSASATTTHKPRASGVRFVKSHGNNVDQDYEAYLSSSSYGDVILSAGSLGSPQILLLSGIGQKQHLQKFSIPLIHDLNGVGQEMKDNPRISLRVDSKPQQLQPEPPQVVGIANNYKFILQSGIVPLSLSLNTTMVRISAKLGCTSSKGKLELNSTDPRQNPSVTFNYLSTKTDLDACVKMSRLVHQIAKGANSINSFLGNEYNGSATTFKNDEMRNFCLKNVRTFYHFHGGCAVGSVVDKDYRVYGIDGLRVVDGSTLIESPGTNPMATLLMLGRYQGIKILHGRSL